MGITISHTNYAPLSLVSTILGFVSFTFTLATLLKVFWSNLGTFSAAPREIQDYLSGIKQGLLEERRHLRRVRKRMKSVKRDRSHGPGVRSGGGGGGSDREGGVAGRRKSTGRRSEGERSKRAPMFFDRDIQSMRSAGEDEALKTMRNVVRDLIAKFRSIEHPFLKPELQHGDAQHHWSSPVYEADKKQPPHVHTPQSPSQGYYYHSDDDSPSAQHMHSTNRLGHEYRTCGFRERWLWVRRKAAVLDLMQTLSRLEVRRTAHEVGAVFSMVCNVGRDMEDLHDVLEGIEGRLNRVVGVRRVD